MIEKVHISRFKSIKALDLDCRRINVFIGEPNTGKSNILEAVGGLPSFCYYTGWSGGAAKDFVRFEKTANLFYDETLDEAIQLNWDNIPFALRFEKGQFHGQCVGNERQPVIIDGDHSDIRVSRAAADPDPLSAFKFYRFRVQEQFQQRQPDFLLPPWGTNLLSLLMSSQRLRSAANGPFASMGLRLGLRPQEGKIEVIKQMDDVIISYPYSLVSETLQRVTFYQAAILTNKDSILFFEEPEAHAFPFYTKYLAELIALDQRSNQYFISTHNPYFLEPLVAKTPTSELAVYIVYFNDYQTKVKRLTEEDLSELGEIDVFSNLERYLPKRLSSSSAFPTQLLQA